MRGFLFCRKYSEISECSGGVGSLLPNTLPSAAALLIRSADCGVGREFDCLDALGGGKRCLWRWSFCVLSFWFSSGWRIHLGCRCTCVYEDSINSLPPPHLSHYPAAAKKCSTGHNVAMLVVTEPRGAHMVEPQ